MMIRFTLQPFWVRLLISAPILAVFWSAGISLSSSPSPSVLHSVVFAVFVGVALAAWITYSREPAHRALVEALASVDKTGRGQAIAAVVRGDVPSDPELRSVAIRLGSAYLGGKSADQLKRQERQTWMVLVFLGLLCVAGVVVESSVHARLYFVALALISAVVLPLGLLRARRIQRNISTLAEGLPDAA
ncbi:hypothetical protein [Mycobacterium avium]|uniref:Uncharacterized protein n=2 Tax=Mycobacterium avium TaxID=1764 RepID=A0A2A3LFN2_MYCAV|nr:hypothetical protein [Mycobacterium avium]MDV3307082.1 hypothetical protein [Mycobacterium avium subsp. hominissuis]PBJ41376.1 hypothetical protein XV03_00510 [Mycobacterium avium subsp. hominissuis]PBJ65817.1 hypothetical protein BB737_10885 [Mycobacterium avium subsp. hominissuis]QWY65346.1 hypothetical protein BJP78_27115 [Mycobacterium avium subsp. hominissuis]